MAFDVPVSALYVRSDSIYKSLGIDCWDSNRDARNYAGPNSVIVHPPCRSWSRVRGLARPLPDEKDLAIKAIEQVTDYGGVLEHPVSSTLWSFLQLPLPGQKRVNWIGFTICVDQHWWGHLAQKKTFLYIVGIAEKQLPPIPYSLDAITHRVGATKVKDRKFKKKSLTKKNSEATPEKFALWLIEVAKLCYQNLQHENR